MAKRKLAKRTPEEIARSERVTRMLEERIAYHRARAEEEELERHRRATTPAWRRRLFPWRLRL